MPTDLVHDVDYFAFLKTATELAVTLFNNITKYCKGFRRYHRHHHHHHHHYRQPVVTPGPDCRVTCYVLRDKANV
jgi:hypothetical protein